MNRLLSVLTVLLFVACSSNNDSVEKISELETGKKIAGESFKGLSQKLMAAMADGGPENAVQFCNVNALSITDSLSEHFGVTIKRSALKYRNSQNKPDSAELSALVKYSEELRMGLQPEPFIIQVNGKSRFFAPIPTKTQCLVCHGMPNVDISENLGASISEACPDDMAVGFQEGDLRGIWSITFKD